MRWPFPLFLIPFKVLFFVPTSRRGDHNQVSTLLNGYSVPSYFDNAFEAIFQLVPVMVGRLTLR